MPSKYVTAILLSLALLVSGSITFPEAVERVIQIVVPSAFAGSDALYTLTEECLCPSVEALRPSSSHFSDDRSCKYFCRCKPRIILV